MHRLTLTLQAVRRHRRWLATPHRDAAGGAAGGEVMGRRQQAGLLEGAVEVPAGTQSTAPWPRGLAEKIS